MLLLQLIQLIAFFSKQSSFQLNDRKKQNLCLDKAYHSKEVEQELFNRGYIPDIPHRREEKLFHRTHPARRCVVERTNSWHNNRFRKLFTSIKKINYLGLVQLANSLIVYRKIFWIGSKFKFNTRTSE